MQAPKPPTAVGKKIFSSAMAWKKQQTPDGEKNALPDI